MRYNPLLIVEHQFQVCAGDYLANLSRKCRRSRSIIIQLRVMYRFVDKPMIRTIIWTPSMPCPYHFLCLYSLFLIVIGSFPLKSHLPLLDSLHKSKGPRCHFLLSCFCELNRFSADLLARNTRYLCCIHCSLSVCSFFYRIFICSGRCDTRCLTRNNDLISFYARLTELHIFMHIRVYQIPFKCPIQQKKSARQFN